MKTVPIVTYREGISTLILLKTCVDSTPQGGLDMATVRARLKVSAAIEKTEAAIEKQKANEPGAGTDPLATQLEFEDAVYESAQECIRLTRWIRPEKHIASFATAFGV